MTDTKQVSASANAEPVWVCVDAHPYAADIITDRSTLYQRFGGGTIWKYTRNGESWDSEKIDNPAGQVQVVASKGYLYQRHENGQIWRYTGTPLEWDEIDHKDNQYKTTMEITADGELVYQRHANGQIWATRDDNWKQLDGNSNASQLTASGGHLYQLHGNSGEVWQYSGVPLAWDRIYQRSDTAFIQACGDELYLLRYNGEIYRYKGSADDWEMLDNREGAIELASCGGARPELYQRLRNGEVWRYLGPAFNWEKIDGNSQTVQIAAADDYLYQLHDNGQIWGRANK